MRRLLAPLVFATFTLFLIATALHALPFTRQPDVQSVQYAFELLGGIRDGDLMPYLTAPKKYPLPYVGLHAFLYALALAGLALIGRIPALDQASVEELLFTDPSIIHLVTRLVTVAGAVAAAWIASKCVRRLFPDAPHEAGAVLLLASPLFLSLATSMRPHVPHIALLLLTFWLSMRLADSRTPRNALLAFCSALLAFGVLQNGLFAFIFPFLALGWGEGGFSVRRLVASRYLFAGFLIGVAAVTVGYPFLWKELFVDHKLGVGFGNEDIGQTPWGIQGYGVLIVTMLGSELILLAYALASVWLRIRGRIALHPYLWAAAAYCVLYVLVFGMVGWATPRYFLPVSAFLAVLGAPAFGRAPRLLQGITLLLVAAIHLQLAALAVKPDTYDVVTAYLRDETRGSIASGVPHYHLGVTPTRASVTPPSMARERWLLAQPENQPGARHFLPLERREDADIAVVPESETPFVIGDGWRLCLEARGAAIPASMFLWSEIPTALLWIPRTERLGPPIFVYCRE